MFDEMYDGAECDERVKNFGDRSHGLFITISPKSATMDEVEMLCRIVVEFLVSDQKAEVIAVLSQGSRRDHPHCHVWSHKATSRPDSIRRSLIGRFEKMTPQFKIYKKGQKDGEFNTQLRVEVQKGSNSALCRYMKKNANEGGRFHVGEGLCDSLLDQASKSVGFTPSDPFLTAKDLYKMMSHMAENREKTIDGYPIAYDEFIQKRHIREILGLGYSLIKIDSRKRHLIYDELRVVFGHSEVRFD